MWLFCRKGMLLLGWSVIAASWCAKAASREENRNQSPFDSFSVNQENLLQVQVNIEMMLPKGLMSQRPLKKWEAFSIEDWMEQRHFLLSIDELIRPDNDEVRTAQKFALEQTLHTKDFYCFPPTKEILVLLSDDAMSPPVILNCTASVPILIPILGQENRKPHHVGLPLSLTSVALMVALWEPHSRHCWTRRLVHLLPWNAVTQVALRAEVIASPRVAHATTTPRVHCLLAVLQIFVFTILSVLLFFGCCSAFKKTGQGENEFSDLVSAGDMDQIENMHDVHQSEHQPDDEEVLHPDEGDVDDASSVNYHALAPRPEPEASSSEDEDDLSPPSVARCTNVLDPPSPWVLLQCPPLDPPATALDLASLTTATELLCLHNESTHVAELPKDVTMRLVGTSEHHLEPPAIEIAEDAFSEHHVEQPAIEIAEPDHLSAEEPRKHMVYSDDAGSEATTKSDINGTPTNVSLSEMQQRNNVTLSTNMKKRKSSPPPEEELPEVEKPIPTVLHFSVHVKRPRAWTPPSELAMVTRVSKQQRTSPDFSYISTLPPDSLCSDDDSKSRRVIPDHPETAAMPPSETSTLSCGAVVRSPLVVSSFDSWRNAVPDIPISLSLLAAAEAAKDTGMWTFSDENNGRVVKGPKQHDPKKIKPPRRSVPQSIHIVGKKGRPRKK